MFDALCEPEHCGFGGWLYDYQTLVAGVLAVLAAAIAIGGQVWLHLKNERDRQIDRSNAITLEMIASGAQLGVALDAVAKRRDEEGWDILSEIDLPNAVQLSEQCQTMLFEARTWLPGPDTLIMSKLAWQITAFRGDLELARSLLRSIQTELATGKQVLKDSEALRNVATSIKQTGAVEMPAHLEAEHNRLHRRWWQRL